MELARYHVRIQELWGKLTPVVFFMVLCVVGSLIMLVGTCSMYSTDGPLPPPRPPPPRLETSAVRAYRYKEGYYRAQITDDAKKVGVWADMASMKKVNAYFKEFTGNQLLSVGSKLETEHLLIRAMARKIFVGEAGQGYRAAHLILRIINKTDRHLAYRVQTRVKGQCHSKAAISHNALALKPEEKIERTECLLRGKRDGVRITRVEVMELTPLGYHYVSRLDPMHLRLSQRIREGHRRAGLPTCRIIPWRLIQRILERDEGRWRDVIDFYSRHNCDEYSFFSAYQYREGDPGRIPAQPPSGG